MVSTVCTFFWRLGRNVLPNRVCLCSRGIDCPSLCVFCEDAIENNWHMFLICPVSIACWRNVHLSKVLKNYFFRCERCGKEQLTRFGMTLWSLWKRRNEKLWESKIETQQQARRSQTRPDAAAGNPMAVWTPPLTTVFVGNEHGELLMARTDWCRANMPASEGEPWGLLQTLNWASFMGWHYVILGMDSKQVVDDVLEVKYDNSEYGCLIEERRTILTLHNNFQVVFARQ